MLRLSDSVLHWLDWDQRHTHCLVRKLQIDSKLFVFVFKFRVLFLFDKKFHFRVTHRDQRSIQLLLGDLSLFLDGTPSKLVISRTIVHGENRSLERVNHKLVSFFGELRVHLHWSVLVQPLQLPVVVLVPVEFLKPNFKCAQRRGDFAHDRLLHGPVTIRQHFTSKVDVVPWIFCLVLVLHHFTVVHIFKHRSHIVYDVQAALNFELLEHELFGFGTNGSLV